MVAVGEPNPSTPRKGSGMMGNLQPIGSRPPLGQSGPGQGGMIPPPSGPIYGGGNKPMPRGGTPPIYNPGGGTGPRPLPPSWGGKQPRSGGGWDGGRMPTLPGNGGGNTIGSLGRKFSPMMGNRGYNGGGMVMRPAQGSMGQPPARPMLRPTLRRPGAGLV